MLYLDWANSADKARLKARNESRPDGSEWWFRYFTRDEAYIGSVFSGYRVHDVGFNGPDTAVAHILEIHVAYLIPLARIELFYRAAISRTENRSPPRLVP